jgi:hypothetical protein
MCTVTFWPKRGGYRLGMNRDERRTRPAGLPPARFVVAGRRVLHPREPAGGTWISVNDAGAGFALVNWYAVAARAPQPAGSRGEVVLALRDAVTPAEAARRLAGLPLGRMNPFRLVGVFDRGRTLREWRWNLEGLEELGPAPEPRQWISSAHDEAEARRRRGAEFARWRDDRGAGRPEWLRALHASHEPMCGPFSTCMHRADAATVSYTEISVSPRGVAMTHVTGPPCEAAERGEKLQVPSSKFQAPSSKRAHSVRCLNESRPWPARRADR